MKNSPRILIALLAVALLAPAVGIAKTEKPVLSGSYKWGGDSGDLKATFTPDGKNKWKCSFSARFGGRSVTYKGTAEGNLTDGKLYAKVRTPNRQRTFTVHATFEDGAFRGTHSEVFASGEQRTGSLVLRRESSR